DDLRRQALALVDELEREERGHQLLARVEAVRSWATARDDRFDPAEADAALATAFREARADGDALAPAEGAGRLDPSVRVRVSGGVAFGADLRWQRGTGGAEASAGLLAVARALDPDPLRGQVRQALQGRDRRALAELAAAADVTRLPAATCEQLGE